MWARLHQVLLERLHAVGEIGGRRARLDSASVPAKKGACHRSEPDGPGQAGHEAPPRHRRPPLMVSLSNHEGEADRRQPE